MKESYSWSSELLKCFNAAGAWPRSESYITQEQNPKPWRTEKKNTSSPLSEIDLRKTERSKQAGVNLSIWSSLQIHRMICLSGWVILWSRDASTDGWAWLRERCEDEMLSEVKHEAACQRWKYNRRDVFVVCVHTYLEISRAVTHNSEAIKVL